MALEVAQPSIPDKDFNVLDYGAKADGTTLNSAAFQKAIDAAAEAGGGRVVVPEGQFLSGPMKLKSNVGLHLSKGAVLQMSTRVEDYPMHGNNRENLIFAEDAHDVQVTGEGLIAGNGEPWWVEFRKTKGTDQAGPRRPQMIVFTGCNRVRLAGFQTQDPPNCHVAMGDCTHVTIEDLTMTAPDDSPNTDALNLRVRNCVIRRCKISTGDDNIVLLASHPAKDGKPCVQNVAISDCTFGFGHGLSIGSYTQGGIADVVCENINFEGTSTGIRIKSSRGRGGLVENLVYRNFKMKNVSTPVGLTSYYPKVPKDIRTDVEQPVTASTPNYRNIRIENVTVENENLPKPGDAILLAGLPEQPITNVVFKDVKISAQKGAAIYNAKDIRFENVQITPASGPQLVTYNATVEGMDATPLPAGGSSKAK